MFGRLFGKGLEKSHEKVSGSSSYRHVEELIKKGNEICIVSPYIDGYYARFLSKHSSGKKIYVISSSLDKEAARILGRRLSLSRFLLAILLSVLEVYSGLAFNIYPFYYLLAVAATLAIGYFFSVVGNKNISLVIPRRFVHAKIYVSEKEAITGSANLTYRGMHRNVEFIEVMKDSESVSKMHYTFWKLWKEHA